jgi:hypothetical protein
MLLLGLFVLILNLMCQTSPAPANGNHIFSSEETLKLQKANSVKNRIKIYQAASARIQKNLQQSVSKEEFETVPGALKIWISLLARSLEDIETNLKTKKKPRYLINYEIHLRKAIGDMQGHKIKAPTGQMEAFDSCITQAKNVHKKLVEMLFQLNS